jgi:hypothetical protein
LVAEPRNARVQYNLALYYLVMGDQEKARAAYERGFEFCTEKKWFQGAIDDLEMLLRLEIDIQGVSEMKELLENALLNLKSA